MAQFKTQKFTFFAPRTVIFQENASIMFPCQQLMIIKKPYTGKIWEIILLGMISNKNHNINLI